MSKLFTFAGNAPSQAVEATANLAKINLTVENVSPGEQAPGFPSHASVPMFVSKQGENLTQLTAILSELESGLNSASLEWISFAENVLTPAACAWVYPTLGAMPNNKGAINEGKKNLLAALDFLNAALATRTFLVAERPTAADAAVAAALNLAFKQVLAENYRTNIPHVVRWFQTCVNQPEFSSFGKPQLCEKEAQFDAKVFGELNKKDKAPKGKKQAEPKKQEKKADKPKKEEKKAEAAGDAAAPAPAKKGDPWGHLGGKYDMDAWKRCYSNNDTVPVAMDYFWKNLDKENYSCWIGKYKYGNEIPMTFMASNLIRGMFQRIDKMRKHSFGSVLVLGDAAPNIEIEGCWFWKGQDLAFELSDDWKVDYDTYTWTKLNLDDEADRAKVQAYFSWEGDFGGRKVQDGKVWK